ncbi:hypothetical protein C8F04DRAFT_1041193 [Mycena alexandri]|uniref:F-box domain-containing protein n=1 Tax=Mycena alexandri TaxID=1745969 RepID=A0AAD6SU06_9AGAR|nr:hypothetical protein C8F04DRAFT_1041193 [Mycena alexandri]
MVPQTSAESTHRTLVTDRARIAVVKAKILELERAPSSLNEEKDLLQARIDAYTYPVLTLPNEIVVEIFVHFLPIYPETPPMIGRSSPNLLGQICRKWREIALSTPELWRGFTLSLGNGRRPHQKLRLLETWLQRSGSCLLSINMDLGFYGFGDFLLGSIAAHSARWEHLLLCGSASPFPSIAAPFPFLRTFYMSSAETTTDSLVFALHAAPLLRTVGSLPWRDSFISFYPWSQLTMFTGQMILPKDCVEVLTHAPHLVCCNFFINAGDYKTFSELPQGVTHHRIETFILEGPFPADFPWTFLDLFTLPALQKFQVAEDFLQGSSVRVLHSLISRSQCHIKEMYLPELESTRVESYRRGLPMVGSIVNGRLIRDPFFVPRDEELESDPHSHTDGDGDERTSVASTDEQDDERGEQ